MHMCAVFNNYVYMQMHCMCTCWGQCPPAYCSLISFSDYVFCFFSVKLFTRPSPFPFPSGSRVLVMLESAGYFIDHLLLHQRHVLGNCELIPHSSSVTTPTSPLADHLSPSPASPVRPLLPLLLACWVCSEGSHSAAGTEDHY